MRIASSVITHCVSKNDTDVAHYNFDIHQSISVIFGRDVAERACYQMVICYPTSPNNVRITFTWVNMNSGNCLFSHAAYCVSITTLLSEHTVDFAFFSDEKVFTVASSVNLQNDRVYASSNAKKRDIAHERLLRCRPTFSSADGVRCCVKKLGCTELFFVKLGVNVDGRYYREILLKKQMLPVMRRTPGDTFQQGSAPCSRDSSAAAGEDATIYLPPICGLLTVRI